MFERIPLDRLFAGVITNDIQAMSANSRKSFD
jgi:hypothetical protein